jgi:hypothetical protein
MFKKQTNSDNIATSFKSAYICRIIYKSGRFLDRLPLPPISENLRQCRKQNLIDIFVKM